MVFTNRFSVKSFFSDFNSASLQKHFCSRYFRHTALFPDEVEVKFVYNFSLFLSSSDLSFVQKIDGEIGENKFLLVFLFNAEWNG